MNVTRQQRVKIRKAKRRQERIRLRKHHKAMNSDRNLFETVTNYVARRRQSFATKVKYDRYGFKIKKVEKWDLL